MMSRKHYIAVAEILRKATFRPVEEQRRWIGIELAWFLGMDNSNFDKQRFMDAAKLED